MPDPLIVTDYDVKDPNLLLRFLRKVIQRVLAIGDRVSKLETAPRGISIPDVSRELKATGTAPLNVSNLRGKLAEPQLAMVPVYSSTPSGQVLQSMLDGQLVVVGSSSTGDSLYRVIGGNPNSLRTLNPNLSGSTVSVADNMFSIYDNVDITKIAQFECSAIAAGTTRVYTFPDATTTIVGSTSTQTLSNKTFDNSNIITVKDANLTIQDDADPTKQAKIQASAITAGATRTYTLPDADTTIVGTDANQALTNKTYGGTSATLSGSTPITVTSASANLNHTGAGTLDITCGGTATRFHRSSAAGCDFRVYSPGTANINFEIDGATGRASFFAGITSTSTGNTLGTTTVTALATFNATSTSVLLIQPTAGTAGNWMVDIQTSAGVRVSGIDLEGDLTANSYTGPIATISSGGVWDSSGQPGAGIYASAAQTLASSSTAGILFASELWDQGACHSSSTTINTRITVPTGAGGIWLAMGQVCFAASSAGAREAYITANGVVVSRALNAAPLGTAITILPVMTVQSLVDGDYFELKAAQTSTGSINTDATGISYTWLKAFKLC